jgi:hypothetical protein
VFTLFRTGLQAEPTAANGLLRRSVALAHFEHVLLAFRLAELRRQRAGRPKLAAAPKGRFCP